MSVVLTYLSSVKVEKSTSLKLLTLKTVMLLALARPSRSVDLAKLDISFGQRSTEGFRFRPAALTKQARQGKKMAEFFYPIFSADPNLCPVRTLEEYIEWTKPLRKNTQLFISFIKPHGPVTSSTVARWLKEVLSKAGIDTSIFKAHSVRGASTSMAANMGVTVETILGAADWSSESVFRKFYYRSSSNSKSDFATAVLSSVRNKDTTKDTIDM